MCRERLEPSSAVTVHDLLGLPSTCINFDIGNACLGFLNGIHLAGSMISSGQIDYALVVDGEGIREILDNTIARLDDPTATIDDLFENFASLTLGSGSAAMVIGRHSENPGSHKVVRGFFRADTVHHQLCVGSLEQMRTDTKALLDAGTDLAKIAWDDAEKDDWLDCDRYILHQVSRVHTQAMIDVLGLDADKVPDDLPGLRQHRPGRHPVHARVGAGHASPRATGCCAWVSGRGSTPRSSNCSGDARPAAASADSRRPGSSGSTRRGPGSSPPSIIVVTSAPGTCSTRLRVDGDGPTGSS